MPAYAQPTSDAFASSRTNTASMAPLSPIGRQKGLAAAGTVKRGAPAADRRDAGAKSTSSIPTKFETVLNPGPVEQNAFGSRTLRFNPTENDLPGPGNYYKARQTMFEYDNSHGSQLHPSISKRGFGGFASRSSRLPRPTNTLGPSPAAYDDVAMLVAKGPHFDHNRAFTTAVFSGPSDNLGPPLEPLKRDGPSPGPGNYLGVTNAAAAAPAGAAQSSFVSSSDRLVTAKEQRTAALKPGPGQYSDADGVGDVRRRGNMAPALKGARSSAATMTSVAAPSVIYGDVPDMNVTPGPGAYEVVGTFEGDVAFRSSVGTLVSPRSASSMFAATSVDRFGRPKPSSPAASAQRRLDRPGPGQYEVVVHGSEEARRGGATSVFKSITARAAASGTGATFRPPGPAFYSPNYTAKSRKSFHLNAKRQWL